MSSHIGFLHFYASSYAWNFMQIMSTNNIHFKNSQNYEKKILYQHLSF